MLRSVAWLLVSVWLTLPVAHVTAVLMKDAKHCHCPGHRKAASDLPTGPAYAPCSPEQVAHHMPVEPAVLAVAGAPSTLDMSRAGDLPQALPPADIRLALDTPPPRA